MKSKPPKIHEFDPQIYPLKLFICERPTTESIKSDFEHWDGGECESLDSCTCPSKAWTYSPIVSLKSTGKYGVLVSIFNKKDLDASVIAHEATHAARFIWDWLGEENTGVESDAYLVGWIAKCIEKVKNGKI